MDIRQAIKDIILKEELVGISFIMKISSYSPEQKKSILNVEQEFIKELTSVVNSTFKRSPIDSLIDRSYVHMENLKTDKDIKSRLKENHVRVLYTPYSVLYNQVVSNIHIKSLQKGKTIIAKSESNPRIRIMYGPSGLKIYDWEDSNSLNLLYKFENGSFNYYNSQDKPPSNLDIL